MRIKHLFVALLFTVGLLGLATWGRPPVPLWAMPLSQTTPTLTLASGLTVQPGAAVAVPLRFQSGGASIGAITFAVDFDQACLTYTSTTLALPSGFVGSVTPNLSNAAGELEVALFSFPVTALPASVDPILTLNFTALTGVSCPLGTTTTIAFAAEPVPSFGTISGGSVAGTTTAGTITIGSTPPTATPVTPATATPVTPATATPVTPATATPITPATATPVTPATATPVTPATATPVTPATATPVTPATATPVTPATATPVTPATATPVIPATATPVTPATATPITPATATPITPATATPVTPATATPVTPATATPVTPATATPITPATATPVTPATATPITPATATPVTPATATPITPATATPVTPATATPVTPATATATTTPGSSAASIVLSSAKNGKARGLSYRDEDLIAYDPGSGQWAMLLDGSDVGLSGEDVDAFTFWQGMILLSVADDFKLDARYTVDNRALKVEAADILAFRPTQLGSSTRGQFQLYLTGATVGLSSSGENIDALTFDAAGKLLVSVTGSFKAGTAKGEDEDLFALDAATGAWSLFFDGSRVGLTNSDEDVRAAWLDPARQQLYLSTRDDFRVTGARGAAEDILLCTYTALGSQTACTFSVFLEGKTIDFKEAIDGLFIGAVPLPVVAAAAEEDELDPLAYPGDDVDVLDELDGTETDDTEQFNQLFLPLVKK